MNPVADPFMAGREPPSRRPGDFRRTDQGTPQVSDPSGDTVKGGARKGEIKWQMYSRPSNFGKILEDLYSIHKWDQRQNAYGFAVEPTLVNRAQILVEIEDRESKEWKDEADKIIKAAKLVAKACMAADRGTHTHGLAEDDDEGRDIVARIEAGEELGMPPTVQRELVTAWRAMLERDGLEILAVEMPVVNDTYRAAGTLDRVGRLIRPLRFRLVTGEIIELPTGWTGIVDIKTGKRRLRDNGTVMYWQSYAVQVFLYGPTARPYDTETDTRGEWEWEVDPHWALIAHLDVLGALDGKPTCDLILVDLEAGRRAADLCVAAKAWATDATVFSVAQLDVEGETRQQSRLNTVGPDSPSTLLADAPTPSVSAIAGEVEACGKPLTASPALTAQQRKQDPKEWAKALEGADDRRLARLALVDARAALCPSPDEGADWSSDEFKPVWDELKALFDNLDPVARNWRSELVGQATRRGVPFHAQGGMTERRFHINKGLIALIVAEGDGDPGERILRELLAHIIGDVALYPGVEPGHALGSLTAGEAERFAAHVDAYLTPPPAA